MTAPLTAEDETVVLSAVMIVRNEAGRLARCLRSLRALVDEIVVVDTGSTDETIAIAEEHGCVIGHFPWVDDFSAARNHSLELARGEWVLMVDADEVVASAPAMLAEQLLERDPAELALAVQWRARPGLDPMWETRMWRNRPDVRFRGIIHENVMDDLHRAMEHEEGWIGSIDLLLDHDGYEGDQRGISSQVRPSRIRPLDFGFEPPHCLKKNGTLHAMQASLT